MAAHHGGVADAFAASLVPAFTSANTVVAVTELVASYLAEQPQIATIFPQQSRVGDRREIGTRPAPK